MCGGSFRRYGRSSAPRPSRSRRCAARRRRVRGIQLEQAGPAAADPTMSWPSSTPRLVAALMQAFSPGTSPPPVRIPMRTARPYRGLSEEHGGLAERARGHEVSSRRRRRWARRGSAAPCSATMRPQPPPAARSAAATPNRGREHAVEGDRRAAALEVTEDRHPRGEPVRSSISGASRLARPPSRGNPFSSNAAAGRSGAALDRRRALGDHDDREGTAGQRGGAGGGRSPRPGRTAARGQDRRRPLRPCRRRSRSSQHGDHHFDEHHTIVALGCRVQTVDGIGRDGRRR